MPPPLLSWKTVALTCGASAPLRRLSSWPHWCESSARRQVRLCSSPGASTFNSILIAAEGGRCMYTCMYDVCMHAWCMYVNAVCYFLEKDRMSCLTNPISSLSSRSSSGGTG